MPRLLSDLPSQGLFPCAITYFSRSKPTNRDWAFRRLSETHVREIALNDRRSAGVPMQDFTFRWSEAPHFNNMYRHLRSGNFIVEHRYRFLATMNRNHVVVRWDHLDSETGEKLGEIVVKSSEAEGDAWCSGK